MARIIYPPDAKETPGYWLRPGNAWAARRRLRRDHSNEWRYSFKGGDPTASPDRSVAFSRLLGRSAGNGFRIVILADTGEGDRSQYSTLPLIRALRPDFMVINGDVAYPAGRAEDFINGFFRPYRGLNMPIWAVPGNHEYYSDDHGEEFFQIFCTERWRHRWDEHRLRLVPQPGTYWELAEPESPLVLLGVDTGKSGNLDGKGWGKREDKRQHEWLRGRLEKARIDGKVAIILYHIPGLNREGHDGKTDMSTLHQIVAETGPARAVICGHEHNFQAYAPEVFQRYVRERHGAVPRDDDQLHYLVSGGGGAFLSGASFPRGDYRSTQLYPSRDQWSQYVGWVGSQLGNLPRLAKSPFGRIVSAFNAAARDDADAGKYLSFVLVDVRPGSVEVFPVLMDDVAELFDSIATVRVDSPDPPVKPDALANLLERGRDSAIKLL